MCIADLARLLVTKRSFAESLIVGETSEAAALPPDETRVNYNTVAFLPASRRCIGKLNCPLGRRLFAVEITGDRGPIDRVHAKIGKGTRA